MSFFDTIIYRVSKDGQRVYQLSAFKRYDPITMTVLAVGTMAAGQLYEGQAASAAAKSQAAMSKYNAQVQENEAKALEQRTIIESQNQAKAAARQLSSMKSALSKSGAVTTEGAGLLAMAEQGIESTRENQLIGYEGVTGIQRHKSQAILDRTQAKIYSQKAKTAKTASYIKAGGTLLSGFSGVGGKNKLGSLGKTDLNVTSNPMTGNPYA